MSKAVMVDNKTYDLIWKLLNESNFGYRSKAHIVAESVKDRAGKDGIKMNSLDKGTLKIGEEGMGMKKRILYVCKGCGRITSTTNEKIKEIRVCFRCRSNLKTVPYPEVIPMNIKKSKSGVEK